MTNLAMQPLRAGQAVLVDLTSVVRILAISLEIFLETSLGAAAEAPIMVP